MRIHRAYILILTISKAYKAQFESSKGVVPYIYPLILPYHSRFEEQIGIHKQLEGFGVIVIHNQIFPFLLIEGYLSFFYNT